MGWWVVNFFLIGWKSRRESQGGMGERKRKEERQGVGKGGVEPEQRLGLSCTWGMGPPAPLEQSSPPPLWIMQLGAKRWSRGGRGQARVRPSRT